MKAVILAAGEGKRLQPLTQNKPKTMVEYKDKPIIERIIEVLKLNEIDNIAVVTGYKKDVIENNKDKYQIKKIFYNSEYSYSNMVYSLSLTKEFILSSCSDFIVSYGDIIYSSDVLHKLIHSTNADISLIADRDWKKLWKIRMEDIYSDVETFKTKNNKVIELGKKTNNDKDIEAQYIGLFKVHYKKIKDFFDIYMNLKNTLDENKWKNMYMTDYIQYLVDIGWNVKPVFINGGWIEIDSIKDIDMYLEYDIDI